MEKLELKKENVYYQEKIIDTIKKINDVSYLKKIYTIIQIHEKK